MKELLWEGAQEVPLGVRFLPEGGGELEIGRWRFPLVPAISSLSVFRWSWENPVALLRVKATDLRKALGRGGMAYLDLGTNRFVVEKEGTSIPVERVGEVEVSPGHPGDSPHPPYGWGVPPPDPPPGV